VWCFGARVGTAATTADGAVPSAAAAARAVLATASSFSRQHCLYLRPEPHGQGSLRPGRPIVRAVMERVYILRSARACCWRLQSDHGLVKVFDKHHFVLLLVVDQLVGDGADQHETEASSA
jgi:hypothetical protein